ncbi:unnamed protein product [Prorocentrum cordatum]|uniref:Uncharacterized protein n=1 Tax=Prorocentrum cordatum TaxID=2364126 RepID=A0ABN9TT85_9DINO|nr:unnamed protein product [Polarella glacialis]
MAGQIWEVVGGRGSEGLAVRRGPSADAAQETYPERLATGSLVKGLEMQGTHLRYRLRRGAGPAEGWVATQEGDKDAPARIDQLRRALEQELPGTTFDDEVVQYLEDAVPDWAQASEDDVAEAWSPFLLSHASAASDDEAAREVCQRLLARLRREGEGAGAGGAGAGDSAAGAEAPPSAEVEGLREWMERLRLPLGRYGESAQAWCEREGIRHVSGIATRAQDFCSALQLKMLERKRVLDGVPACVAPAQALAPAAPGGAAESAGSSAFGAPNNPYSIRGIKRSSAREPTPRCTGASGESLQTSPRRPSP